MSANSKLSATGIEEVIVANESGGRRDLVLLNAKVHAERDPMIPPTSTVVEPVTLVGNTRTGTVSFTLSGPLTHHIV